MSRLYLASYNFSGAEAQRFFENERMHSVEAKISHEAHKSFNSLIFVETGSSYHEEHFV